MKKNKANSLFESSTHKSTHNVPHNYQPNPNSHQTPSARERRSKTKENPKLSRLVLPAEHGKKNTTAILPTKMPFSLPFQLQQCLAIYSLNTFFLLLSFSASMLLCFHVQGGTLQHSSFCVFWHPLLTKNKRDNKGRRKGVKKNNDYWIDPPSYMNPAQYRCFASLPMQMNMRKGREKKRRIINIT
ncbi:hypothetical protein M431DRAFT_350390 [Trichoderma harzianum CBS 226.95]|uniref:Transmembrane protein n=1 Tax=Trichoderma harzianum CBS 226.95 TaxID=983964 RepID=A0A2T4AL72_TRIHA|nr:hypothetical protein M431DRAFT_350390 [Trichoderma harzianum CBS 226.95]PTB57807.1 hypothetical protein M431DRAFT_350390 [Trichoderma harzianum CBS 226.95]